MTKNTMSKEEYLNKSKELNIPLEKPKVLTDTDFITIAKERRSVRQYDAEYVMTEEEIQRNPGDCDSSTVFFKFTAMEIPCDSR